MNTNFADYLGQEWKLHLTYGSASAVQRETGVNLTLISKDKAWVDALFSDPSKLVSILWILCEEQATKLGISPEEFGYRFDGPTLEAAGEALAFSVAGFFPRSKIGQAIQKGLKTVLDKADETAIANVEKSILTALNGVSNSPVSSELTPLG